MFDYLNQIPQFRTYFWKGVYELLAKSYPAPDWKFMNYGYVSTHPKNDATLQFVDEEKYGLQLYHKVASGVDLTNKCILEVGSGRGGGANYIAQNFSPTQITGLDFSSNAVRLSTNMYKSDNLIFVEGSAMKLPFENESLDVIISVEASHVFPHFPTFLKEAVRTLKKGGCLLLADFRSEAKVENFHQDIINSRLIIQHQEDISLNVCKALELDHQRRVEKIEINVHRWFQPLFKQFAATKGTGAYKKFTSGERVYWYYILSK